jgi:hypothetical protein
MRLNASIASKVPSSLTSNPRRVRKKAQTETLFGQISIHLKQSTQEAKETF